MIKLVEFLTTTNYFYYMAAEILLKVPVTTNGVELYMEGDRKVYKEVIVPASSRKFYEKLNEKLPVNLKRIIEDVPSKVAAPTQTPPEVEQTVAVVTQTPPEKPTKPATNKPVADKK